MQLRLIYSARKGLRQYWYWDYKYNLTMKILITGADGMLGSSICREEWIWFTEL